MDDVPEPLRGAFRARAAHGGPVLVAHDRRAALGAALGEMIGHGPAGALLLHDLEHLGDYLPGLAHAHGVAYAHVELCDEVLVVQRGVRHRRTREADGLYHRLRREHAGAAHLDGDVPHDALLDLGRVFIRRGPARGLGRGAEGLPLGEGVYLHDRAVYVVGEAVAALAYLAYALADGVHIAEDGVRHDVEAVALERVEALGVGGEAHALGLLDVEDADIELPRCGDLGILLAHAARGGVARVREQGLPPLGARGVQLLEYGAGHIDLAAHYEPRRRVPEPLGQVADGFQVLRHVLAGDAVAARRAADEYAVFVLERHGEAVYLRLDAVLPAGDGGGDALVEGAQLLEGEDVVQALERHLVHDGRERALRRAADVLRGGIGVKKLRVRGLELL